MRICPLSLALTFLLICEISGSIGAFESDADTRLSANLERYYFASPADDLQLLDQRLRALEADTPAKP